MEEVIVQRRFPTFDFVIRSGLDAARAGATLEQAMLEPTKNHWPFPKAQLWGSVSGTRFSGRPRTSVLGGNAAPSVSGFIIPREGGGSDIVVRVIDWFVPLIFTLTIGGLLTFGLKERSTAAILRTLGMGAWLSACGVGLYLAEAAFVRRIFKGIFGVESVAG